MDLVPVSRGNLYQVRRFCGISKDREDLSSPEAKLIYWEGVNDLGTSEAVCLIAYLHPAPPAGIPPRGFNIQNIPLFF